MREDEPPPKREDDRSRARGPRGADDAIELTAFVASCDVRSSVDVHREAGEVAMEEYRSVGTRTDTTVCT